MKTNSRTYLNRSAFALAASLLVAVSPVIFADEDGNKSQGPDTHATDRSSSAKSGSGNSSVPNGQMTQSGHNGTVGSNAGGDASGSQYSTNNTSTSR